MTLVALEAFQFTTNDGDAGQYECEDAIQAKYVAQTTQYGRPRVYDGWNFGKACALARTGTGNYFQVPFTADDEIIVGFAYKPSQLQGVSGARQRLFFLWDTGSGVGHVSCFTDRNSSIMFFRGTSWNANNHLGTVFHGLRMNRWTYVEIRILIHDTTGQIEVKLDGVQVANWTNLDTRNGGSAAQATILQMDAQWSSTNRAQTYLLDDFYFITTGAGTRTTFMGPGKIEVLYPDAEGTNIDFTPSTGTDNSALVDECPTDDTDYNESSTTGHYDLLTADNLTDITGGILGMQLNVDAKISDATTYDMFPTIYTGATQYDGSTETISEQTDWQTEWDVWEQNPNTSLDWTTSDINGLEIGYEVA